MKHEIYIKLLLLGLLFLATKCNDSENFLCDTKENNYCCDKKNDYLKFIYTNTFLTQYDSFSILEKKYKIIAVSKDVNYNSSIYCVYDTKNNLLHFRKNGEYCSFYKNTTEGIYIYNYLQSKISFEKTSDSILENELVDEVQNDSMEIRILE